jgi:hypothetical protein
MVLMLYIRAQMLILINKVIILNTNTILPSDNYLTEKSENDWLVTEIEMYQLE